MVRNNLNYIDLGVGNVNSSRQLRTINLHARIHSSSSHNGPLHTRISGNIWNISKLQKIIEEKLDFRAC